MHRRDFLINLSLAGGALAGLAGCAPRGHLRVGVHPWIGYESLYLAEEFGWLPDAVSLIKGRVATDSVLGLLAGRLDAAALTLDEALRVQVSGEPVSVVAVMDVSAGADVVMARGNIRGPEGIRGARVAVEPTGVSAILLIKWLEAKGIARSDIEEVQLPVDRHADAFRRGDVDISVSYEPVASELESLGARRLFDSRSVPDTIFDVLVVRRAVEPGSARLIRELVSAHFRGVSHLVSGFHDALYRVADHQGVDPEVVRRSLASVTLPDLALNHAYLGPGGRIDTVMAELAQLMYAQGMIEGMPAERAFVTRDYLNGEVL